LIPLLSRDRNTAIEGDIGSPVLPNLGGAKTDIEFSGDFCHLVHRFGGT